VVSSFPLGEIIRNPDATGRIAKWSVELMGETLAYASRKAIKSHVPRRYNEEADEHAKIASGRITVPPNVFARDIA
jgi:hypothetical protein